MSYDTISYAKNVFNLIIGQNMEKRNIFQKKQFVILFALIAMFAWGCAYPFIKLGMQEWNIANDDAGGKMLFAGVRFTTAGILTLGIARIKGQSLLVKEKSSIALLLLFGLTNTALHYYFFYSGLAYCEGGKASIINSLSPYLMIILATIIFKEKITVNKVIGCILGFLGIIIVNYGTSMRGFSFQGEGMIVLNCICSAIGGILTRIVTKKVPAISATGYSLSLGGIMLVVEGLITGGRFTRVTLTGVLLLLGLITISMVGFILYNQLICYNPISEIAIFNALIPVFGTMMSCLMLDETFGMSNLLGLLCTSFGIFMIHFKRKGKTKEC